MNKGKTRAGIRRVVQALPIAAIFGASLFPIQPNVRHLLVAATLVWLQIILIDEVFQVGK